MPANDPYLVPKPDPNEDALSDPRVTGFLDKVSKAEGADYNTLVGGSRIDDLSRHPNRVGLRTKAGPSTAFGRYQITGTTNRTKLAKYADRDYSPRNQDLRAVELLRQTGALDKLLADDEPGAVKLAGREWASLPGSLLPGNKRPDVFRQSAQDKYLVPKQSDPYLTPKAAAPTPIPSPAPAPRRQPKPAPDILSALNALTAQTNKRIAPLKRRYQRTAPPEIIEAPEGSVETEPGQPGLPRITPNISGAPTMSSVLAESRAQYKSPQVKARQQMRSQIRAQVEAEYDTANRLGMGSFYAKNPLTAVSELVQEVINPNYMNEQISINREVDRREQQIEEDTKEALRLFTDSSGKYRQDVLDEYNSLVQKVQSDPQWFRSADIGLIESGARVFRTVAGLASVLQSASGAPLPPGYLSDNLRRKALLAERAMQTIRDDVPLSAKEEAAAFVTATVGDLAQLTLFTEAGGPVGGFAAHGGIQAIGRNAPARQVIGETAEQAAIGAAFKFAPVARRAGAGAIRNFARESAFIGGATAGVETLAGHTPAEALQSAGTNIAFHGVGQIPGVVGSLRKRRLTDETPPTPPVTGPTEPPAPVESSPAPEVSVSEGLPADLRADIVQGLRERTEHYSNRQPRRQRNVKTGKKGQFKAGKPAEPEPTVTDTVTEPNSVEVKGRTYTQDELGDWYDTSGRKVKQDSVLRAIEVEQATPAPDEVVNLITGKKMKRPGGKQGGGFVNVTEIQDAIEELKKRFPMFEDAELRAFLEEKRPYLFRAGVSRAEEAELTRADTQAAKRTNELARLDNAEREYLRTLKAIKADYPEMSPDQARKWVADNRPELMAQLEGDLGVQNIESLRTDRGPVGHVDPTSPVKAANEFAKKRLEDFAAYYGDEGNLTGRQPKTPEERRAEFFRMPADAEFKVRKVADGSYEAEWYHPTKPLLGHKEGFATEAEAQRYVDEVWKSELATDLTDRDIDAGPRGNKLIEGMAKQLAHKSEAEVRQVMDRLEPREQKALRSAIDRIRDRKKSGEGGFVDLSEIRAAIKKVHEHINQEEDGSDTRVVVYDLKLRDSLPVRIVLGIDKDGTARPYIGSPDSTKTGLNRADLLHGQIAKRRPQPKLSMDGVLALKRFFQQEYPEIKRVEFSRMGTTGGEFGRNRTLSVRPRSGEEGYLNVGDIAAAIRDLKRQFPEKSDAELRALAIQQRERLQPSEVEARRTGAQALRSLNRFENLQRVKEAQNVPPHPADARAEIRELSNYLKRDYDALHKHQARRLGLDKVSDDVASNYFTSLRDFTRIHDPASQALVDRAEAQFAMGNPAEATRLSEQALSGTHEFASKLGGALIARETTPAWHEVVTEVRDRLKQLGGPAGALENFLRDEEGALKKRRKFDPRRAPYKSRPDTEALSYIVDPVIEKLWIAANQRAQAGKLKARDLRLFVSTEFGKILNADLSDWHILNRQAARAVAARRLSQIAGTEPAQPLNTPPAPPLARNWEKGARKNKLWQSLARAGREPGTETHHDPQKLSAWKQQADQIIRDLGPQAAQKLYDDMKVGPVRVAIGQSLGDYYQIQAARSNDPAMLAKSVALANERVLGAVEAGRTVKAYDLNNRFELSGSLDEATKLYRQAINNPTASLPDDLAREVNKRAVRRHEAKQKVEQLEQQVAQEPQLPPRKPKLVKRKDDPSQRGSVSLGPLGERPDVKEARKRKSEAAKTLKSMEKAVGKYWTKASHPQLETARVELRDATHDLALLYKTLQQRGRTGPLSYAQRLFNLQRSLMVSAFPTAARNTQTQVARSGIERLTDAIELTLRRAVGLPTEFSYSDIARNFGRLRNFDSWTFSEQILKEHPDEFFRMYSVYAGGVEIPFPNPLARGIDRIFGKAERFAYHMNYFNRVQEFHIRSAEFLAELELHTARETGMSLEEFVAKRGADKLPSQLLRRAVDKALEVTFAANPPTDTDLGSRLNQLIRFGNLLPPTMSPAAFPRFMYNNLKFLYQYNPLGGGLDTARIVVKNARARAEIARLKTDNTLDLAERDKQIATQQAKIGNVPRALGRWMIGTSMFLLGYQIRNDDRLAGEKWYELKTPVGTVDTRPFGPFSTYLFMGELARRWWKGERSFSKKEWTDALGVSTAPGGLSAETIDRLYGYWERGDLDKMADLLKRETGDMARAMLTPIRQLKDVIAQFSQQERITRDVRSQPILGPIRESIPFASRSLPPAYRPTSGRPIQQEAPLAKVATGYRKVSPKSYIEQEADRLHFRPNEIRSQYTGRPELDRRINQYMGEHLDAAAAELRTNPRYQKATDAVKFLLLKAEFQRAFGKAKGQAAKELRDDYRQYKLRQIPAAKRAVIEERQQAVP